MHKAIKAVVVLSACLNAPWTLAETGDSVQQVHYQCERDVAVPVTYLNTTSGGSYAVLQVDGQQVPMEITISASGARYASVDAERGYTWDTKGDSGSLYWQPADSTEGSDSVTVLADCSSNAEMLADNTQ